MVVGLQLHMSSRGVSHDSSDFEDSSLPGRGLASCGHGLALLGISDEEFEGIPDDCDSVGEAFARACAHCVVRYPRCWLALWAVLLSASAYFAPDLLDVVKDNYDPAKGMPSYAAMEAFERHYSKSFMGHAVDSVLFMLRPDTDRDRGLRIVEHAANALGHQLDAIEYESPGLIAETRSWRRGKTAGESEQSYISKDNRTWLLEVDWRNPVHGQRRREKMAVRELLDSVRNLNKTYAPLGLEIVAAGGHALWATVKEHAREDIGVHAVMFLPVGLLLVNTQLCCWQLLLLPVICCTAALLLSFAIGFAVASQITVDSNVPTLMAFLGIALVIDWTFFLLARFREEAVKGARHEDAIVTSLVMTGANIALSGLMILMCSSAMLVMPTAIASNAIGGSITVLSGLSVCLTLLPACLAYFPSCFAGRHSDCGGSPDPEHSDLEEMLEAGDESAAGNGNAALDLVLQQRREVVKQAEELRILSSPWYCWARLTTRWPANIIVLVVICIGFTPATLKMIRYVPAVDESLAFPPHAPAVIASKRLETDFEGKNQRGSQVFVLVEKHPQCAAGVRTNEYFQAQCDLANRLSGLRHDEVPLAASDLLGISFYSLPGQQHITCLPWKRNFRGWRDFLRAYKHNQSVDGDVLLTGNTHFKSDTFIRYHKLYEQLWARAVSSDESASVILMQLPWSAMDMAGFKFIKDLRSLLQSPAWEPASTADEACSQVRAWELSMPSISMDYVETCVGWLPLAILAACGLTAPFIAISFCSVMAAPKLLLTVLLPLTWIYGLAIWCFQDGLLDFLGPHAPMHSNGGLHWMVPASSAMLLMALALDYNIFYFGRVFEYRKAGLSDFEAIRRGLVATGPVITTAGLIFAIEFTGLLFSSTGINKQGGFVIVLGIVLDTFIVRSCMMPAVLSLGASWNWWPTQMPQLGLNTDSWPASPACSCGSRGSVRSVNRFTESVATDEESGSEDDASEEE
mmetsp:Transcript_26418/g.48573  ORF Transcript_26418/g.48573 Transcript_26418/m.48573 type:complete len:973 (+) Transcript_26418:63-2981(+)